MSYLNQFKFKFDTNSNANFVLGDGYWNLQVAM